MSDVGDAAEVLHYLVRFWGAVFLPSHRMALRKDWSEAGFAGKAGIIFEGLLATVVGLGLPALVIWLFT